MGALRKINENRPKPYKVTTKLAKIEAKFGPSMPNNPYISFLFDFIDELDLSSSFEVRILNSLPLLQEGKSS